MQQTPALCHRQVGFATATFLVVANMVGTGVFTSLGFQLLGLSSTFALMMLWLVGGIYALCGALAYGELAAAMPDSGGEYHFLSRIYHPAVGFVAGWVSVTVGFAAPVAAASMALGQYLSRVLPGLSPTVTALSVALMITLIHFGSNKARSGFQGFATLFKVAMIGGLILCGLVLATPQPVSWLPHLPDWRQCTSPDFAISLVYVTYSYSGWNASVYLAGEVKEPTRNIPRSLVVGTLIATALYLLLNFVFLYTTPMSVMVGQVEIGYLAGQSIFGATGARIMGLLISIGLISSISSMTWAGPRVMGAFAGEIRTFRYFAPLNRHGVPQRAVLFQLLLVVILVLTSTFETVITYLGFTLAVSTFLTVLGVFIRRWRWPHLSRPYSAWGYPVTPLIFLIITGWMLVYLLRFRTRESLAGLATVGVGLALSLINGRKRRS